MLEGELFGGVLQLKVDSGDDVTVVGQYGRNVDTPGLAFNSCSQLDKHFTSHINNKTKLDNRGEFVEHLSQT